VFSSVVFVHTIAGFISIKEQITSEVGSTMKGNHTGMDPSHWIGLMDKLRLQKHSSHSSFYDIDCSGDACSPTSLVETMSSEISALRERLESVESIKLEFVQFCTNLEDEIEKYRCSNHSKIQEIKVQNEALKEENSRLVEEYQQLKRIHSRYVDDYAKRELEYMNQMNDSEKLLQNTRTCYEAKIDHLNALISSLNHEKEMDCNGMSNLNSDHILRADADLGDLAGHRVRLLEQKLVESEQMIANLREQVQKLIDQRNAESDLKWLEEHACM
jgi:hypothetical protein